MTASLILNWLTAELHRSINKSAGFSKRRTPLGAHLSGFSHPLPTKLRIQKQMCSPSHKRQRNVNGLRCAISYWEGKGIRWPRGLRRGSAAAPLVGLRIRIPPGVREYCASAMARSLAQGISTEPFEWYSVTKPSIPTMRRQERSDKKGYKIVAGILFRTSLR
jgi:hypothetical protein